MIRIIIYTISSYLLVSCGTERGRVSIPKPNTKDKLKICAIVSRALEFNYTYYNSPHYYHWFHDSDIMVNLWSVDLKFRDLCNFEYTELDQFSGYNLGSVDSLIAELKCLNEKCGCEFPDSLFLPINFYFRKDTFENITSVKENINKHPNKYYQKLKTDDSYIIYPMRSRRIDLNPPREWWNVTPR